MSDLTGKFSVMLPRGTEVAQGVRLTSKAYLEGDSRQELERFLRVWLGAGDLVEKIEAEEYVTARCVMPRGEE